MFRNICKTPFLRLISRPGWLLKPSFLLALPATLLISLVGFRCFAAGDTEAAQGNISAVTAEAKAVKVSIKREGDVTRFYVENDELCEITMTFEMGLVNLKSSLPIPATMTFPPREVTEAFTLSPVDPASRWEYSYTNYYKLGSNCAHHDDSYIYQLPYAPGRAFKVTQGYNGSFSHKGANQYAIDWKMPQGTPVFAARGGMVIKVKDDSDTGGSNMSFDHFNNYVLIRHEDGTLAHYCHLQKGGCRVVAGQKVKAGDLIAHSGNTGFSSGPHLHFCVFKTKNGRERESIPVKFATAEEQAITLKTGRNYKATRLETATAQMSPLDVAHQGGVAP
jgi:murein DD-endopeptidase MepM/ murein hydrolase activator NlpD